MFSPFENEIVRSQCGVVFDAKQRKKFLANWNTSLERRASNWQLMREKERQSTYRPQLDFVAATCEFTVFLAQQIDNAKGETGAKKKLDRRIPYFGYKFFPSTYTSEKVRKVSPDVAPDLACLKPVTVLHPALIDELNFCPRCNATGDDLAWHGWTTSGPRDVHGVYSEEQVIGVQMRCKMCKKARGKEDAPDEDEDESYCWGTASSQFWGMKKHWEIPIGLPHMKWRSAVTSDLYDLIVEFRPDMTSAGFAEHIKQLHLLQYHKRRREYLVHFEARAKQQVWPGRKEVKLKNFPEPRTGRHQDGYDNTSISDEQVSDIYLSWVRATRQEESEESLRTKTGVALSIDATFRTASKATVVNSGKSHTRVYKGGITSVLNEDSLIIAWRFCFTQGNWELVELLKGLKERLTLLGVSEPEMVISDCCCHVSKAIHDVFPDAVVCLDVWHLLMRYLICLVGGSKSPVRSQVARDVVDAILKSRALVKSPAIYWSKEEQETRLDAAFKKWEEKGVWTAAGARAHEEQLGHVRKGCLTRPRDDVRADGSRIEGTHKGWNSLQRSFSSGLEMMTALGHDYVLRHNLRVESALKKPSKFVYSTFGSHHVHLVNDCARRWNKQLARKARIDSDMEPLPVLEAPRSGETFGMVKMSLETAAHQSLASIKNEPADDTQDLLDLSSQDLLDPSRILSEVGIDPLLLYQLPRSPLQPAPSQSALPSATPHPCTSTHDSVGFSLNPPGMSSGFSPRSPAQSSSSPPGVMLNLPTLLPSATPLSFSPPLTLYDPDSKDQKATIITTVKDHAGGIPPHVPVDIIDVDALFDTDAPEPEAAMSQAVKKCPKGVDRKGKGVDRSNVDPQPSRKRACESGDTASQPLEVASTAESAAPSQSKPPPRKRLRLTVPGTAAAAASKTKKLAVPTGSTSVAAPTLDQFLGLQAAFAATGQTINTTYFPSRAISGLTRSQRVFSVASGGIDPRSLSLAAIDFDEFKLFLRLRVEGKWTTHTMSPFDWVCAASAYNIELSRLNEGTKMERPLKTPRALMDKLFELEQKLIGRIISNNYQSRSGQPFWFSHCHALPLRVGGKSGTELAVKLVNGKKTTTKVHTCHRCERIMYPGPTNSPLNHPRGVCADGVWQSARQQKEKGDGKKAAPALEEPPPYPQPEKLFTSNKDGHAFHAERLVQELHTIYQRIMAGEAGRGPLALHDVAFAQMLRARAKVLEATPTSPKIGIFKPYLNVKSIGVGDEQMYSYCGEDWIRVDFLAASDNDLPLPTASGSVGPSQPAHAGPSQPAHAGPSQPVHTGSSQWSIRFEDSSLSPGMSREMTGASDLSRGGVSTSGVGMGGEVGTSGGGVGQDTSREEELSLLDTPDMSREGLSLPGLSRAGSSKSDMSVA